jgi:hypothetical protein
LLASISLFEEIFCAEKTSLISEIMDALAYVKPGPFIKAGTALFFGGSTPDRIRLSSAISFVLIYFPVCCLLVMPSISSSDELL